MIENNKSFKDGKQFAWDSTSLQTAQACLRKYQLSHLEGWKPRGRDVNLRFGGHYATALEHYFKHVALGMDQEEALVEVVWEALRDTWDRLEDGSGQPWDSGDSIKTRETLIRTIVWYIDQFADDPTPVVILSNGKPAVEYSFSLPVDNDLIFCGHIDRLVNYGDDVYVMDQKTTKMTLGARYFDQYKPNTQMSMYTFAGQIIYGNPVSGVIIDAAQIAVGFSRFERGLTARSKSELDEWYDNSMWWIAQVHAAADRNYYPMNPMSCNNYGGCPFRTVCSVPENFRQNFLKGDFQQLPTWDPLDRR